MVSFRGVSHTRSVATSDRGGLAEAGETLLEVLFSVMLMGVAFTAILGGMFTSARVAKLNQEKTRASVALQAYAERLLQPVGNTAYRPCAPSDTAPENQRNSIQPYPNVAQYATLPPNWRVRVTRIDYLREPPFVPLPSSTRKEPNYPPVYAGPSPPTDWDACYALPSMSQNPPRDNGLQLITVTVEKPDGGGAGGYLPVDSVVITKRDQRCPTNLDNADQGPC